MTKHRVARRDLGRRGVKLIWREDRRVWCARWADPLSKKTMQETLDPRALPDAESREAWARTKATELATTRMAVAAGGALAVRKPLSESIAEHMKTFGTTNTVKNKKPVLTAFVAWALERGVRDAQDVTRFVLAAWRDHVARPSSTHAANTRNLWLRTTATWAYWARRNGQALLSSDDVKSCLRRVRAEKRDIVFLRPQQIRELLGSCLAHDAARPTKPMLAPFVLAVLLSGCRFDEVARLEWSEVDLAGNAIRLDADRTKTRSARAVSMAVTPALRALLQAMRLRADLRREKLVFPWVAESRKRTELARHRAMRDYGAPSFTWHGLRRSAGSLLTCAPGIFGAASAFLSAKQLGHSVVQAEKAYVGTLTDLPKDATSIEAAGGFADLATRIVAAIGAVVPNVATAAVPAATSAVTA